MDIETITLMREYNGVIITEHMYAVVDFDKPTRNAQGVLAYFTTIEEAERYCASFM